MADIDDRLAVRNRLRLFASLLIAAVVVTACATDGPTDSAGIPTAYGEWRDIDPTESALLFDDAAKPEIVRIRMRVRNETEWRESIGLRTDSPHGSWILVTYLPYDTYYTVGTTEEIRDPARLIRQAKTQFLGAALSQARQGRNRNGDYLFATAKYGDGSSCVYAVQGYDLKFTATRTEMTYDAIVRFRYCSSRPTDKALRIFDGMNIRK